jgi:hypothetical protein
MFVGLVAEHGCTTVMKAQLCRLKGARACAAAGALAARGKVKRLPHGQQRDVAVALHRVRRRAPRAELAQGPPVVRHLPRYLRSTQQLRPSELCLQRPDHRHAPAFAK